MSNRLLVTYQFTGSNPREVADALRVEQTIEFPNDLAPQWIQEEVVGKIENIESHTSNIHVFTISYNLGVTGNELPQFLNVVWGNASLFPGIRVIDLVIPNEFLAHFKGPRFGVAGLRSLFGAKHRPLITTALKPMGSDSRTLASMAATLSHAGFDLIKDDHSLANQPWAVWRERVKAVSDAVNEANSKSGSKTLYAPSLNLPFDQIHDAAYAAKEFGAGALLVLPGISGFDAMRALAENDDLALPIQAHPAMLGSHIINKENGIGHGILLGTIARLAGADVTIFPNAAGRFSFTREECLAIRDRAQNYLGDLKQIWVAPAGGMTLERIPEMVEMYGRDTALLIGGALSRGNLAENAEKMRNLVAGLEN